MKALIERAQGRIQLLGSGSSESQARISAYSYVNPGANLYDNELPGYDLVDMTDELADALEQPLFNIALNHLCFDIENKLTAQEEYLNRCYSKIN